MKNILLSKKLVKIPGRFAGSKKGDNGKVLIVGGSEDYVGALALAGVASMRSGADSTLIMCPERAAYAINALSADLVTRKLKGRDLSLRHFASIAPYLNNADALLIGNGIRERRSSDALIKKIITAFRGPKVLDARALFVFDEKKLNNALLLPNPKEFIALKKRIDIGRLIASGNIIVTKGYPTKIMAGKKIYISTANPSITKAGTGDVLAGLAAGFLAQSHGDIEQSALNSVYFWHQTADILSRKKKGFTYLASDLAKEIIIYRT
jgi:NAD(P)H-hydrate epimerase